MPVSSSLITAVVSGATIIAIPSPRVRILAARRTAAITREPRGDEHAPERQRQSQPCRRPRRRLRATATKIAATIGSIAPRPR